jgi:membrane protein
MRYEKDFSMKWGISPARIWKVLKESFKGFSKDKVAKLSGSLAYSTVFSMGPMLVVLIALCGLFLEREAIEGKVYSTMQGFVGHDTAAQLQEMIRNAGNGQKSKTAAIIGVITLLIGATSVFAEIQDSVNTIWGLKPKPRRGWVLMLKNRFLSFSVIVSLGFILLVSLVLSTVIEGLSLRLQAFFPDVAVAFVYVFNLVITLSVSVFIFGVIFKVLPDAEIRWKHVFVGALVTAILFMLGKAAIGIYISSTKVGSTYGAAGSLVVLLVWVYYSSFILYFGAEFTRAFAVEFGAPIHPNSYAVTVEQVEVEKGSKVVEEKPKDSGT